MEKIKGKCKCCTKITKFIDDPRSMRIDKISYKYSNNEESEWQIYCCKNCKKPIHERWETEDD